MKLPSMVLFLATAPSLTGCTLLGPASIANGRAVYNEVINKTEDEQLLNMIVRERYDETSGMLAVASVTASISTRAKVGGQFGIGPDDSYDTNLVPLSVGFAYEENPTISYIPVQGESTMRRLVMPITIDEGFVVLRAAREWDVASRELFRSINSLQNPIGRPPSPEFERFIDLYVELRHAGVLRFGRTVVTKEAGPQYVTSLSGYGRAHR